MNGFKEETEGERRQDDLQELFFKSSFRTNSLSCLKNAFSIIEME